jgi:GNAT superfamily N-acetyltransferase
MYAVRPAQPEDISAVIQLTEMWKAEPGTTGHYEVNFPEALRRELGSYFWIAADGERVVGFIRGTVNGDSAGSLHYQILRKGEDHLSLSQLYVHPDHRNRGVGSQLVAKLFAAAASNGIHRHLVMSENLDWEKTMRFYQKHGFRPWYFRMFTGRSTEER